MLSARRIMWIPSQALPPFPQSIHSSALNQRILLLPAPTSLPIADQMVHRLRESVASPKSPYKDPIIMINGYYKVPRLIQ